MAFYDEVHTSKKFRLGTRVKDSAGREFIYLQGVGSTVAEDWVVYDELHATARTTATSKGPIAIAMAAVDATTEYGWYGIWGKFQGDVATGTDDGNVWLTATAGRVDNTDVAGDMITNAVQRSATASNSATFDIRYPFAHQAALD